MSARAKHARHFGQEAAKVGVLVRGFDIDHRIEGFVGERQVLRVALHELQAGQPVLCPAEVDAGRIQVQPRVGGRT
ncbi:Uncharacterised protein [Mycobacterium tuberculosis]|uniref:Uncharacterized protein n=1 Tax=Mycobacterium tuberculosis TaxID=1773 RepID=A0A654ZEX5_MYCTX|nr:Uncharacterised protein [Mycobacterium tuberculosis]CFS37730.1 Uncharacterised protein [Mycobacterium tuberculosis]CKP10862.1 Uncharacterised protein [Mycobacterium tuberculosis]CKT36904.1 Uncharacterised protein [Mycobacterium tuberculosis]CKU29210.1 Uncharacterised protein [Mycobacterium tuberculosis]